MLVTSLRQLSYKIQKNILDHRFQNYTHTSQGEAVMASVKEAASAQQMFPTL